MTMTLDQKFYSDIWHILRHKLTKMKKAGKEEVNIEKLLKKMTRLKNRTEI